jgi:hypothetical protein
MRLGQLARRLSLRPNQLVDFLAKNGIQIDPSSNTRLEDSHVEIIVQHYAPGSLDKIENEPDEIEEVLPVMEAEKPALEPIVFTQPLADESKTAEEIEVIRVQKIELSGLKVLGKIELPEPKKKELTDEQKTEEVSEVSVIETPLVEKIVKPRTPNRKPAHQNNERPQQRPWKNPLESQREREARKAEEKKRVEIESVRERRKKHYEEKVKAVAQPKRAKPVKDQPEVKKKPVDTRPVPKTWFGKFLRWWTT